MAKLILETPHLSQMCINDKDKSKVFVYSEEPFLAHVEDGKLVVGNKEEGHVLIDVTIDHIYEDIDLTSNVHTKMDVSMSLLPNVDLIEFDIDEKEILAQSIKFKRLLPLGVLELTEIEYNGIIYKGVRNSSLNHQR